MDPRAGSRMPLRLLGEPAVVVRGAAGVRLFYNAALMRRADAMPVAVSGGLFGAGAVHSLDDAEHAHRKGVFIQAVMDPDGVRTLLDRVEQEWERTIADRWRSGGSYAVVDAAVEVYGRALLWWAGFEVESSLAEQLARQEAQIVDGFAVPGPAWVRSQVARRRCDAWFIDQVRAARAGMWKPREGTPLDLVLAHRELDGQPLTDEVAAVEVQNMIRPGVATARFAAFLAVAMHEHPAWREQVDAEVGEAPGPPLSQRELPVTTAVVHEVRRYYPFVPLLPARARRDLEVEGVAVRAGERVLLDVYGTNHDERHWSQPERFDPSRFLNQPRASAHPGCPMNLEPGPESFIPQGGGRIDTGHRCPGEAITVGLLVHTAAALARLEALVDRASLGYSLRRMPTAPRGGVILSGVRQRTPITTPASPRCLAR